MGGGCGGVRGCEKLCGQAKPGRQRAWTVGVPVLTHARAFPCTACAGFVGAESDLEQFRTYGPFTLYKNSKAVNKLFTRSTPSAYDVAAAEGLYNFDEWGQNQADGRASMSWLINHHKRELGLVVFAGLPFGWDGHCADPQSTAKRCGECVSWVDTFGRGVLFHDNHQYNEVLLCNFHAGQPHLSNQLRALNGTELARVVASNLTLVSHREGLTLLDDSWISSSRIAAAELKLPDRDEEEDGDAGVEDLDRGIGNLVPPNLPFAAKFRVINQRQQDAERGAEDDDKGATREAEPKVMLFTAIYGASAAKNPWLPLFLKTAVSGGWCGKSMAPGT